MPTTSSSPSRSPPLDEEGTGLFTVLANERRQCIVQKLSEAESPVALADMARDIATMEVEDSETINHEDVEQILIHLHHDHVPKLCDHDVASYNQNRRTISDAANTERAQRILTAATTENY